MPQDKTKPDQWEYQIQCRILMRHKVIYVMCEQYRTMAQEMGFQVAADVNEALGNGASGKRAERSYRCHTGRRLRHGKKTGEINMFA